ncbi:MAG: SDR family oxidoreductase, partial [Myxococcales bacterium]|nr:SDR family oxidoreductase [Myxococcales bacterium]
LAQEWAGDGIRVNAVCPGVVDTPMHADAFGVDAAAYAEHLKALGALHPLGRVGTPEEVAAMIAFLCSPAAAWTTGGLYPVDGGISLT